VRLIEETQNEQINDEEPIEDIEIDTEQPIEVDTEPIEEAIEEVEQEENSPIENSPIASFENKHFECELSSSILEKTFQTLKEINDKALFVVSPNGIKIVALDRALVCLAEYTLDKKTFSYFNANETIEFVVDVYLLYKAIKTLGSDINWKLENSKLLVRDTFTTFVLPIYDKREEFGEMPEIDKLTYEASIYVDFKDIKDALEKANLVSDAIIFEVDNGNLILTAEGDVAKVKVEIPVPSARDINKKVKAKYPINYLEKINWPYMATISFSNDYPIQIEFDNGDYEKFKMIIAPRVEE